MFILTQEGLPLLQRKTLGDVMDFMEAAVKVTVNGHERPVASGSTVADLLRELKLDSGRVAIERNLEILPRPKWAETRVESGDRFEIVQFVGGG